MKIKNTYKKIITVGSNPRVRPITANCEAQTVVSKAQTLACGTQTAVDETQTLACGTQNIVGDDRCVIPYKSDRYTSDRHAGLSLQLLMMKLNLQNNHPLIPSLVRRGSLTQSTRGDGNGKEFKKRRIT